MARILTLRFEYDDGPWLDITGSWQQADVLPEVMDTVNDAIRTLEAGNIGFIDARLDDCLLVSKDSEVSDEVSSLHQYKEFMRIRAQQSLPQHNAFQP